MRKAKPFYLGVLTWQDEEKKRMYDKQQGYWPNRERPSELWQPDRTCLDIPPSQEDMHTHVYQLARRNGHRHVAARIIAGRIQTKQSKKQSDECWAAMQAVKPPSPSHSNFLLRFNRGRRESPTRPLKTGEILHGRSYEASDPSMNIFVPSRPVSSYREPTMQTTLMDEEVEGGEVDDKLKELQKAVREQQLELSTLETRGQQEGQAAREDRNWLSRNSEREKDEQENEINSGLMKEEMGTIDEMTPHGSVRATTSASCDDSESEVAKENELVMAATVVMAYVEHYDTWLLKDPTKNEERVPFTFQDALSLLHSFPHFDAQYSLDTTMKYLKRLNAEAEKRQSSYKSLNKLFTAFKRLASIERIAQPNFQNWEHQQKGGRDAGLHAAERRLHEQALADHKFLMNDELRRLPLIRKKKYEKQRLLQIDEQLLRKELASHPSRDWIFVRAMKLNQTPSGRAQWLKERAALCSELEAHDNLSRSKEQSLNENSKAKRDISPANMATMRRNLLFWISGPLCHLLPPELASSMTERDVDDIFHMAQTGFLTASYMEELSQQACIEKKRYSSVQEVATMIKQLHADAIATRREAYSMIVSQEKTVSGSSACLVHRLSLVTYEDIKDLFYRCNLTECKFILGELKKMQDKNVCFLSFSLLAEAIRKLCDDEKNKYDKNFLVKPDTIAN